MKTTFYGRVSTDSDDQLNSLTNQISFFDEHISENGFEKVECGVLARKNGVLESLKGGYADEGISGKSLTKREAFKQMMRDAKARKFDLIITKSVARFGRSVEDTAKSVKDLKEYGVGVFFLDLKVNSLDNSKEFMINLFASLAQEESNNKSYIVQFGIRKAQKSGKFTGQAPYGYDIIKGFLKISVVESEVVKRIYHLYYNESYGTGKIARLLNSEGFPTKQGGMWSQIQISRILDNPIYKGLQIQHMTQVTDINRNLRKEIQKEDWITHQIDDLVIIDSDFFNLVQIEKQRRLEQFGHISYIKNKYVDENGDIQIVTSRKIKRSEGRHSNTHILSNLLACKNCGFGMKRKKRKAHIRKDGTSKDLGYEWKCTQNDMYGKDKCAYPNTVTEADLIEKIKKQIIAYREDTNHEATFNLYLKSEKSDSDDDLPILEQRILKLSKQVDLNFELLSEDRISKDEYEMRNGKLQKDIAETKENLRKLTRVDEEAEISRIRFNSFIKFLEEFDVDNLSNGHLRKIIRKIHIETPPEIDHLPDELTLNGKLVTIEWSFIDKGFNELISV